MAQTTVLSLGGSIVAPEKVDTEFIKSFLICAERYLERSEERRLIIVVGGGAPAREYQRAYRQIVANPSDTDQDWIGVAATRLNAELIRAVFASLCSDPVVTNPEAPVSFGGRVLVAAGWKPGFSSDNDAVILAKRFGAQTVINLSNIARVYTADPRKDPLAKPIDSISWKDFKKLVGTDWVPGKNVPFDPVATAQAESAGLSVICAAGRDIENLECILEGKPFQGTIIGPQ